MIPDRKGILALPIKLTVSFLIIALMVPATMSAVDTISEDIDARKLLDAAEILGDRIDKVGSEGPGYRTTFILEIPDSGYLEIGGAEGRVVRAMSDGHQVGRVLLSSQVTGDILYLEGYVILSIHNDPDGEGVAVEEL